MQKTFLIDGNALVHRAFHALPPLSTPSGENVNAVYGFSSMLLNLINDRKPDFIAVAFDTGKTFRHEQSADYKATRVKAPDELYAQFDRIKEVLRAFQMPIFEMQGFEADDLLGTLAKRVSEESEMQVFVVTSDRDSWQLVNDKVFVLMPQGGFSKAVIFDKAAIKEKTGLNPEQVVDYKSLCGDSSDNIKGVPGIGDKTACALLNEFESLEKIYENLDKINPKIKEKLETNKHLALESQMLSRIVCDLDLDFHLKDLKTHEVDFARLEGLFGELGFNSLLKKIEKLKSVYNEQIRGESGQQSLF
jgi:DNA polymerase-1